MSTSDRIARILFCTIFVLFSSNSGAFEFDGAWVTDAAKCAKVFVKKSNRISMTKHAELFGGGFIVEGDRIRGPAILFCMSLMILSPMQLDIKIEDTNNIVRFFSNFSEIAIPYTRCTL